MGGTGRIISSLSRPLLLFYQIGTHDEALRRVPDEFERVARDERQRRMVRRIEHVHIVWSDDERLRDAIFEDAIGRGYEKRIADFYSPHRAEGSVAMTGDADVAGLTGKRGVLDVAGAACERSIVRSFKNRCFEIDPRRFEASDPLAS